MIYVIVGLICYLFSFLAEKHDNKRYLVCLVLLLSLFSGFRASSVGIDTSVYVKDITLMVNGLTEYTYYESGFELLCLLLGKISKAPNFSLTVYALLINGLILFRFWDFRKKASLRVVVLSYYCVFFLSTLNTIRQYVAVAIIFFFSRYLQKGKYFTFGLSILVASLFHSSALLGVLFYGVEFFMWRSLKGKEKIFLICSMIVGGVLFAPQVLEKYNEYHSIYFQQIKFQGGFLIVAKLLLLGFSYFSLYRLEKVQKLKDAFSTRGDRYLYLSNCMYYLIGLFLVALGYFFTYMSRIGYYYYIFEPIYFGVLMKRNCIWKMKAKQFVILAMILLLIGYQFIVNLLYDGYGVLPYTPFWK